MRVSSVATGPWRNCVQLFRRHAQSTRTRPAAACIPCTDVAGKRAYGAVGLQAWPRVTTGTDLDRRAAMRFWIAVATLLLWPIAAWHTLQARRRLRAYALPPGSRRLTLERVA
jgi:hypothetical protein